MSALFAFALVGTLLAYMASQCEAGSKGTEFSVTFPILTLADTVPSINYNGRIIAPCEYTVLQGRRYHARRIQFTPTMRWLGGTVVHKFCWMDENYICQDLTPAMLDKVVAGLERCYGAAVAAGYTGISLMHHVDPQDSTLWRAKLNFDPIHVYGHSSYDHGLLAPSAKALAKVITHKHQVWFAVAGEQGLSTFRFPKAWKQLIVTYRTFLKGHTPHVQTGTSLNRNVACACVNMGKQLSQAEYAAEYPKYVGAAIKQYGIRVKDVQALFAASDFFGVSLYNPAPRSSPPYDFPVSAKEVGIQLLNDELSNFGVHMRAAVAGPYATKSLIVHELGLGGGDGKADGGPAKNMPLMVSQPFNGVWYPYDRTKDPWAIPAYRAYRERFHNSVVQWLSTGGVKWRIEAAFLFTVGSWDVLGVHFGSNGYYVQQSWGRQWIPTIPGTGTDSPYSFRDVKLVTNIAKLNKAISGY